MGKLDGKVALITGAAVGLGEGISTAYAKYGAKLVMVDLDPKVEETAARLRKEYGAEIVTVVANVAAVSYTHLQKAADNPHDHHLPLDLGHVAEKIRHL